jgi:hypothetical protein
MIQSRRRFLVCAGLAVAAAGAVVGRGAQVSASRRRLGLPHERAYGLIEDIGDRQLGEFVAHSAPPEAPPANCRAQPG